MFQISSGFNPCHMQTENPLELPSEVQLLELGPAEAELYKGLTPISLHIARSPISEPAVAQELFLSHLCQQTRKLQERGLVIKSLGFHLCGSRFEDLGRFGMTSHFMAGEAGLVSAQHFIEKAQQVLSLPIWIENANFYSSSAKEIIFNWKKTNELVQRTGAGFILDLSHLVIDAINCGLDPMMTLGAVDLSLVQEIHLSGIRQGQDGTLHDGHSLPVDERVWKLLRHLLEHKLLSDSVYLNLEHTEPSWGLQRELYYAEFQHLSQLRDLKVTKISHGQNRETFGKSYLKKILQRQIPNLEIYFKQKKLNFDSLFKLWISETLSDPNCRLSLNRFELYAEAGRSSLLASESFLAFLKSRGLL